MIKRLLHRLGIIPSPSLAFSGIPYGLRRRDLAGEVMRDIAIAHASKACSICDEWTWRDAT